MLAFFYKRYIFREVRRQRKKTLFLGVANLWEGKCKGFPGGSVVKNLPASAGDADLIPGFGKIPWSRKWQPTLVFLPGHSNGQGSLASYSP